MPLALESGVSITLDTKDGFVENLSALSDKTGLNLMTLLTDCQPKEKRTLNFDRKPVREVLDSLAAIYRMRWRVVDSQSGVGAFILVEEQERQSDKERLQNLKKEMASELEKRGWQLPEDRADGSKGFGGQLMKAYNQQARQTLNAIESRLDSASLDSLANEGIEIMRLPGDIRQSLGGLLEGSQRAWLYNRTQQMLFWLLKR
ncbi:MAG: hypothetical protein IT210_10120 [Armatimonadetes bacterium]|nr:hypothetical protein [Armatimonadota bacterium]